MKIQYLDINGFLVNHNGKSIFFNPPKDFITKDHLDIAFCSLDKNSINKSNSIKKQIKFPGEFEVSGILAKGLYTDEQQNIVYKVIIDEIVCTNLGNMQIIPTSDFFKNLGTNTHLLFLNLSEKFNFKQAKIIIEDIMPRFVICGGDNILSQELVTNIGAKIINENTINITENELKEDKTEIIILNI